MFKILNINFDSPTIEDVNKWNYKEWKEAKSNYKEIWLNSYVQDENKAYCRMCYKLTLKNNSSAFLEDKKLKDKDLENAIKVFDLVAELREQF